MAWRFIIGSLICLWSAGAAPGNFFGYSNGNTVWVDPNGNDQTGRRGDPTRPFKTLYNCANKTTHSFYGAVTAAQAHDTIIVQPGVYYSPACPLNVRGMGNGVNLWIMPGATVIRTNKYYDPAGNIQTLMTASLSASGPMIIPGTNSTIVIDGDLVCTNATDAAIGWFESADTWTLAIFGFTNFIATNVCIGGNGRIRCETDALYFAHTSGGTPTISATDLTINSSYDYLKVSGTVFINTKGLNCMSWLGVAQISQGVNMDTGVIWNDYQSTFGCGGGPSSVTTQPLSLIGVTANLYGTRLYATNAILLSGVGDFPYFYSTASTVRGQYFFHNSTGNTINTYRSIVSQSGTGAPTETLLENGLGSPTVITWARTSAGLYTATFTGAFTASKTFVGITLNGSTAGIATATATSANVVTVRTFSTAGAATDSLLSSAFFEVVVYP